MPNSNAPYTQLIFILTSSTLQMHRPAKYYRTQFCWACKTISVYIMASILALWMDQHLAQCTCHVRGDHLRYKFLPIREKVGLLKLWGRTYSPTLPAIASCPPLCCRLPGVLYSITRRTAVVSAHFAIWLSSLQISRLTSSIEWAQVVVPHVLLLSVCVCANISTNLYLPPMHKAYMC